MLNCRLILLVSAAMAVRQIRVQNRCTYPIWINPLTSDNGAPLVGGIQRLMPNLSYIYNISDAIGWKGGFWPKTDCDAQGQNCIVGQSLPPCGTTGCQPPAHTKIEFSFPPLSDRKTILYDISLIDGYSLPAEIMPNPSSGLCVRVNCRLILNNCPTNEANVNDLRVQKNGRITQCMSPCKKWTYAAPLGLNRSDRQAEGLQLCCPTPVVSRQQCQAGIINRSLYVNLIRRDCPTAYSYVYDEKAVLHSCPNPTNFVVIFC